MKSFEEALDYLLSKVSPLTETETLPLDALHGKVLAEAIVSPVNVPPHPVATMDGYALHSFDLEGSSTLPVSQRIAAGDVPATLELGTAARIFTGAQIPQGANAVVMQEETAFDEPTQQVTFQVKVEPNQNIRQTGASIREGQEILPKGKRLTPQDVGLIASIGQPEASVYRPLKIATFTTGDELLAPGMPPEVGKIYNSNHPMLKGLVEGLGFEWVDLGTVEDTLTATVDALKTAATQADVILTTGGVSVGEEDHIKPAVEKLGHLDLWKVKMKPGKPLAYGEVSGTPFIGLPGNPVSAFATFYLFARPYLRKMQGERDVIPQPIYLEADFEWTKPNFRREFARAKRVNQGHKTVLQLFPNQDSGVLTSTVWADGFAVIPEDSTITKGDVIAFYPFPKQG